MADDAMPTLPWENTTDWCLPGETWLPVPELEGWYEGSDFARVRGLSRTVPCSDGRQLRVPGLVLRQTLRSGYLTATLTRNCVKHHWHVHRLVAELFLGSCPDGEEVLHGPLGALDNRASSLRYGTRSQNLLDMRRDGTHHLLNREVCPLDHVLAPPNLVAYFARRGHRNCLACDRGRNTVRNNRNRGVTLDLKTESDRHYARIMAGEAPPRRRRTFPA